MSLDLESRLFYMASMQTALEERARMFDFDGEGGNR